MSHFLNSGFFTGEPNQETELMGLKHDLWASVDLLKREDMFRREEYGRGTAGEIYTRACVFGRIAEAVKKTAFYLIHDEKELRAMPEPIMTDGASVFIKADFYKTIQQTLFKEIRRQWGQLNDGHNNNVGGLKNKELVSYSLLHRLGAAACAIHFPGMTKHEYSDLFLSGTGQLKQTFDIVPIRFSDQIERELGLHSMTIALNKIRTNPTSSEKTKIKHRLPLYQPSSEELEAYKEEFMQLQTIQEVEEFYEKKEKVLKQQQHLDSFTEGLMRSLTPHVHALLKEGDGGYENEQNRRLLSHSLKLLTLNQNRRLLRDFVREAVPFEIKTKGEASAALTTLVLTDIQKPPAAPGYFDEEIVVALRNADHRRVDYRYSHRSCLWGMTHENIKRFYAEQSEDVIIRDAAAHWEALNHDYVYDFDAWAGEAMKSFMNERGMQEPQRSLPIIEVLLDRIQDKSHKAVTESFTYAAPSGYIPLLNMFLKHGVPIDGTSESGLRPIDAAFDFHTNLFLLENGSPPPKQEGDVYRAAKSAFEEGANLRQLASHVLQTKPQSQENQEESPQKTARRSRKI